MDIVTPDKLRNYEMKEDLSVLDEEDEKDPFVRPKRVLSQKQKDNLAKGREALKLKREQQKSNMTAESEIQDEMIRLGRKLTLRERRNIERKYEEEFTTPKKMEKRGRPKKPTAPVKLEYVTNDVIERAEQVDLSTAQEKKFEEIKQLSQEELDEKEFDKFIKMMGKFETMVSKMEEKKRLEQEEAERKERELEEKYYKKFMERQQAKQQQPKQVSRTNTYLPVSDPQPTAPDVDVNYTEEEQKYAKYF